MDYEKKYKEALEKARQLCDYPTTQPFISDLQDLFPELKESEDERIRKEIITHFKAEQIRIKDPKRYNSWLTWLEKGKNNMGISEATKQKLEDNLNKALEQETPESWNEFLEKQDEQKPAWSEEDENGLGDALWAIQQARTIAKDENDMGNLWYAEKWLKSLKDRVQSQPKQGWSEEDDRHRIHTISLVEDLREWANKDGMHSLCLERCAESIDWLKSIRPQNRWKPSDKQMEALKEACDEHWEPDGLDPLYTLYQDLKKLK